MKDRLVFNFQEAQAFRQKPACMCSLSLACQNGLVFVHECVFFWGGGKREGAGTY